MEILKLEADKRRNPSNKEIVIFCPVGDAKQFHDFQQMMIDLGIDHDKTIDFLFVQMQGLNIQNECGLSAMIYTEDKVRLGTSGSFFAGQVMAYQLNYKIIIVADIDVELDSKETLNDLIIIAEQENKIIMPQCKARTTSDDSVSSSVWGYGTFPRAMLDKHGFCTGYFWKGSEDFDYNCRVAKDKMEYNSGWIYHPHIGFSFYHKYVDKKKMYQYLGSLMKNFLLQGNYKNYIAWYMYNSFLSNVYGDIQLRYVLQTSNKMEKLWTNLTNDNRLFVIKKVREKGLKSSKAELLVTMVKSLGLFLMGKPFDFYTDRIWYVGNKINLLKGIVLAILKLPVELLLALAMVGEYHDGFKGNVPYPITIKNYDEAEKWMLANFPKS